MRMYKYFYTDGEGRHLQPVYLTESPPHLRRRFLTSEPIIRLRPVFDEGRRIRTKLIQLRPGLHAHAIFFKNGDRIDAYNKVVSSWKHCSGFEALCKK